MTEHLPLRCARCKADLFASIMSRFNMETICLQCAEDEEGAPNYGKARAAEFDAVKHKNYNFPGIGLAPEDVRYLADRLKKRKL